MKVGNRPIADAHESLLNMNNSMRYLIVDGNLSGTGVRDAVEGGWLTAPALGISERLVDEISEWQKRYGVGSLSDIYRLERS